MNLSTGAPETRELFDWGTRPAAGTDEAIFVVHGMGQQKTFETQAQVAEEVAKKHGGNATATARHLMAGDQRVGVVELSLPDAAGKVRRIDVYEAYWAPLTEGEIGLKEVISFLFRAGITSLPRRSFRRWMFGKLESCKAAQGTAVGLLLTLLAIAALVAVNAVVVSVVAARVTLQTAAWATNHLIIDLSVPAGVLGVLLLQFGVTMLLALRTKRFAKDQGVAVKVEPPVIWTIWLQAVVFYCMLLTIAALMGAAMWHHRHPQLASWLLVRFGPEFIDGLWRLTMLVGAVVVALAVIPAVLKSWWLAKTFVYLSGLSTFVLTATIGYQLWKRWPQPAAPVGGQQPESIARWLLIWALLFAVSWLARGFLVQFVGDVAIYIEPHRVDRFNAVREKIKKCVFDTADVIYRMKDAAGKEMRYGKIVVVAHSLGSVIAYDTLNALIRRDLASGGGLQVTKRTGALITFGSPLDKIAFLFAVQRGGETQEALATTVQPLIDDAAVRPPWINLHAPADIISGSLDYYGTCPVHNYVVNKRDPQARVPFAAHVEYWENDLLWSEIVKA